MKTRTASHRPLNPALRIGAWGAFAAAVAMLVTVILSSGRLSSLLPQFALGLVALGLAFILLTVRREVVWAIAAGAPIFIPIGMKVIGPGVQAGILVGLAAVAIAALARDEQSSGDLTTGVRVSIPKAASWLFLAIVLIHVAVGGITVALLPWLYGVGLLIAVLSSARERTPSPELVRRALLVAGGLSILVDVLSWRAGTHFHYSLYGGARFDGGLADYELTSEYSAAIWLLATGTFLIDRSRAWRMAALLVLPGCVTVELATQTRGGFAILALGTPLLFLLAGSAGRRQRLFWRVLAFGVALSIVAYSAREYILDSNLGRRLLEIRRDGRLSDSLNRTDIWSQFRSLPTYQDSALLGNGLPYPYELLGTYPHSLYLWSRWTWGIPGAVALAAIPISLLAVTARFFRRSPECVVGAVVTIAVWSDEVKIEAARNPVSISLIFTILVYLASAIRRSGEGNA